MMSAELVKSLRAKCQDVTGTVNPSVQQYRMDPSAVISNIAAKGDLVRDAQSEYASIVQLVCKKSTRDLLRYFLPDLSECATEAFIWHDMQWGGWEMWLDTHGPLITIAERHPGNIRPASIASILNSAGICHQMLGHKARALTLYGCARDIAHSARQVGANSNSSLLAESNAYANMSDICRKDEESDDMARQAKDYSDKALKLVAGVPEREVRAYEVRGLVHASSRHFGYASLFQRHAVALRERGTCKEYVRALSYLLFADGLSDDLFLADKTERLYEEAHDIAEAIADDLTLTRIAGDMALIHISIAQKRFRDRDVDKALYHIGRADQKQDECKERLDARPRRSQQEDAQDRYGAQYHLREEMIRCGRSYMGARHGQRGEELPPSSFEWIKKLRKFDILATGSIEFFEFISKSNVNASIKKRASDIMTRLSSATNGARSSLAVNSPPGGGRPADASPFFSWLHISDVHFTTRPTEDKYGQKTITEKIIEDAVALISSGRAPKPQALFLTGDIAKSGSKEQYEEAEEWLKQLVEGLKIGRDAVYLVPGNHDVDRKADKRAPYRGLLVAKLRGGTTNALDESLDNKKEKNALVSRQKSYFEFASRCSDIRMIEPYWRTTRTMKDNNGDLIIKIAGLNTALLSQDDEDYGRLMIGEKQIRETIGIENRKPRQFSIVLSHHPFDWVKDLRGGSQISQSAHVHLCGHVHKQGSELIRAGGGNPLLRVMAGAVHEVERGIERRTKFCYTFGAAHYTDEHLEVTIWPRRWSKERSAFRVDVDAVEDGQDFVIHRID